MVSHLGFSAPDSHTLKLFIIRGDLADAKKLTHIHSPAYVVQKINMTHKLYLYSEFKYRQMINENHNHDNSMLFPKSPSS